MDGVSKSVESGQPKARLITPRPCLGRREGERVELPDDLQLRGFCKLRPLAADQLRSISACGSSAPSPRPIPCGTRPFGLGGLRQGVAEGFLLNPANTWASGGPNSSAGSNTPPNTFSFPYRPFWRLPCLFAEVVYCSIPSSAKAG